MSDDGTTKPEINSKPRGARRGSQSQPTEAKPDGQIGANGTKNQDNQCSTEIDPEGSGKSLTEFKFQGRTIRTVVLLTGRTMFIANDVCNVLGLVNSRQAVSALSDAQRGVHVMDTAGGPQTVNVITESGLYALAFKSEKPEARKFGQWVTEEVLPAIRETGRYEADAAAPLPPPDAPRPLPWDLPAMGRFIVTRVPGRPDHIHETELEEVLVSLVQMDVKVMAFAIKTIEAHWQRSQHFASIEADGPTKPVCPWLERAILDAGRTAQIYIEAWGKKDPAPPS